MEIYSSLIKKIKNREQEVPMSNEIDMNTESNFVITLVADVVAAYVGNNSIRPTEVPSLISDIHAAFLKAGALSIQEPEAERPKPAVNPKRSVFPDYIICLEDGKKFKSLKRHLMTHYAMTPEQYREKWELDSSYPMVAPNYAQARSALAKEMGLGRKRNKTRKVR